jgi:predicted nucleic acid-binding protein
MTYLVIYLVALFDSGLTLYSGFGLGTLLMPAFALFFPVPVATVTRKVARPIPMEEAAEIIRDLSFWQVHTPTAEDVLGAVDIQRHYQVSFWDAMVIHSAKCLGCKVIWSEDLSDGQAYENVQVKNPFKQSTG